MSERSVLVKLQANIADFKRAMRDAADSTKQVGESATAAKKAQDAAWASYNENVRAATTSSERLVQSAQKNREAWDDAGMALAGFGTVVVAGLGLAIKAAIDWESAWTGVTKTVDGSAEEMAALEGELRGLARTLPSTHQEIAAVAEAAGQLGIKRQDVAAFTRTMIDLSQTTNLTADEAATSLAQLMNVMRTSPDDVGRLGASLVALGNAGASTEADILSMAQRLSGAGALIGASESDVLALASAMADVGINAELGGGVMTRVLQKIHAATLEGGEALSGFANVAGVSSAEFARAFEEDPIRAISLFTKGLDNVNSSGGNVVATLSDLGLKGTEEASVLLRLMGASEGLATSLDTSSEAWQQNTALVEEAAKRYDTTASKLAIARNNITDAAIEIGEVFLPVLADLASGVAGVAQWFADLSDPMQNVIAGFVGLAGVGSLAAGAFLLIFPRVIETYKAFQTLQTTMPGVASGLGALGKAAGVAAGMYLLGSAVSALDSAMRPTPATMEEMTAALLDLEGSIGSLDERARALGQGTTTEIDGFADAIKRVTDPSNIERLNDFGGSLWNIVTFGGSDSGEGAASRRATLDFLSGLDSSLALMVQSGNADLATEKFRIMAAEAKANGVSIKELRELFPEYQGAIKGVANDQEIAAQSATNMAGSVETIAPSVESIFGSLQSYAVHLGLDEDATEELIKKTEELGQTLADFINPLGVYTTLLDEKKAAEEEAARVAAQEAGESADAWEQFVVDTGFSFDEYMRKLEEQVRAQEEWQTNMLILAGRVSQGTLDELARLGPEGAPLVADLVNRSDAELDRFDDITAMRSKEATDAWGAQLTMAAPVLAEISARAGRGAAEAAARELRNGTATIAQIARDYGVALAGGVNPLLRAVGRQAINPQGGFFAADGGVVDYYADGGVSESHVAQIAPGGAWRVWAEPETGGEAYIPLAPGKRPRSVDIWKETGRRLGMDVEHYAWGGISDVPRPYSTAPSRPPVSSAADGTMQKAYDEIVAWMQANSEAIFGGIPGSGGNLAGGGGMVQRLFATIRTAFPRAKLNSGLRPGDPGYHGLGRAVDLGESGFAGGLGRPYLADMAAWIYNNFGSTTKELIYTGAFDRTPDLKNGRTLNYGAATNAAHRNHVHWAMAKGGILNPHVRDTGGPLLPGFTYNGTGGTEDVVPRHVTDAAYAAGGRQIVIHSPITFAGPVYGEGSMRQVAESVVAERDAVLARDVRSALR